MAQLKKYKCKRCGYSILAHRKGRYSLMAGECYTFSCSECKEIVSLLVSDLAKQYYFLTCPNCGSQDSLTSWNPVDGHCPKCNGEMKSSFGTWMVD